MNNIEINLDNLGIKLPTPSAPAASYAPYLMSGNNIIVSGQLPIIGGKAEYIGKVGVEYSTSEAKECAKICGINILAQLKVACDGDLSKVKKCLKIGVFVNAAEDYTEHPIVANGVSDLMVAVFGTEIGSHARAAVGVGSLPLGVAVEVEAIFAV